MGLGDFLKKIGRTIGKIAPFALPFIPGGTIAGKILPFLGGVGGSGSAKYSVSQAGKQAQALLYRNLMADVELSNKRLMEAQSGKLAPGIAEGIQAQMSRRGLLRSGTNLKTMALAGEQGVERALAGKRRATEGLASFVRGERSSAATQYDASRQQRADKMDFYSGLGGIFGGQNGNIDLGNLFRKRRKRSKDGFAVNAGGSYS